jgi:hypothetical protein
MCKRPLFEGEKSWFTGFSTPSSKLCANQTDSAAPQHDFGASESKLVRNLLNTQSNQQNGKDWPPPFQKQTPLEKFNP